MAAGNGVEKQNNDRTTFNPSLLWWGTPGNYLNHGETLEHPGGIKIKLKHWNTSSLSKNYLLK